MEMNEKRGPGRPTRPVGPSYNEIQDDVLDNLAIHDTASPVIASKPRGLREAALRTEELRNRAKDGEIGADFYDEFYIDPRIIPEGWDYNWKRYETAGMKDDAYEVELLQAGWEAVDASRHPNMMPPGTRGAIIRKGMMLMERPLEISNIAKQRELHNARDAVASKEKALGLSPSGHFDRDPSKTGVRKSFGPMEIPRI